MPEILTGEWTCSAEQRQENMKAAIETGLPFLEKKSGAFHDCRISIVGYGPSLLDTWKDIPANQPMIATSGAYSFLVERGITPCYYMAIDPRESTVCLVRHWLHETMFLMASVCHPTWWLELISFHVKLWHLDDGPETREWVQKNHPEGVGSLIGGGSTVGNRAFNVAGWLGYRKFDVFGLDGSFDRDQHAGPHNGEKQPCGYMDYDGRRYRTTPQLIQSVHEMEALLKGADIEATVHGEGLMQDIARAIKKGKS